MSNRSFHSHVPLPGLLFSTPQHCVPSQVATDCPFSIFLLRVAYETRRAAISLGLPLSSRCFVCRLLDRDTSPSVPLRKKGLIVGSRAATADPILPLKKIPPFTIAPHRMSYIPPAIRGRYTHHMDGDIATLLEGNRGWQCRIRTSFTKQDVRVPRKRQRYHGCYRLSRSREWDPIGIRISPLSLSSPLTRPSPTWPPLLAL